MTSINFNLSDISITPVVPSSPSSNYQLIVAKTDDPTKLYKLTLSTLAEDIEVTAIEVIDNLTSTDTNKALSANQGRVLNDGKVNTSDSRLTDSRKCNNTFDNITTAKTALGLNNVGNFTISDSITSENSSQYASSKAVELVNSLVTALNSLLGTASTKDVGTSASNVVQLDGNAKIPAIDGSLITGLSGSNIATGTIDKARLPVDRSSTLAFWKGGANPTTGNNAITNIGSATFSGDASWDSTENLIELNTNSAYTTGKYYYDFKHPENLYVRFQFRTTPNANGADAVFFFCYKDIVPDTHNRWDNSGAWNSGGSEGYIIGFNEYGDKIQLYRGATELASATSITDLADGYYHEVDVLIIQNRIVVKYDGVNLINYLDSYGIDKSETLLGFGGWSGGLTNKHYIKGYHIAEATQADIANLGITTF
tara:strand:+ start:15648 stop:16925 length:1278 start_codon:yes stop_codon:yes gene_type:complete